MSRLAAPAALVVLVLAGCTHARPAPTFEGDGAAAVLRSEVNARAERSAARVTLASGEHAAARSLRVGPDETSWVEPSGSARAVPTSDVRAVRFASRGRGALEGAGLGLAVGAAAGAVLGAIEGAGDDGGFLDISPGPAGLALMGAVVLAVPAAAVGGAVGAVRQSRTDYRPAPLGASADRAGGAPALGASHALRAALGDRGGSAGPGLPTAPCPR